MYPFFSKKGQRGIVKRGLFAYYNALRQYSTNQVGQRLIDFSGNNYRGQSGSVPVSDPNDPIFTSQGLSFDGVDDYINVGNIGKLMRTCQIVFYTPTEINKTSSSSALISIEGNDNGYIAIGLTTSLIADEIITILDISGGRSGWCSSSGNIPIGWHLLEVVWLDSKYRIILDGIEKPITTANAPRVLNATNLRLGSVPSGGSYFNGKQAEILLYERTLTNSELAQNRAFIKAECKNYGITIN